MKYYYKFTFFLWILGYIQGISQGQTLSELMAENDQTQGLEQFKDNETSLHYKLLSLFEINQDRKHYGLKPVILDIFASRVANMHCWDMIVHNYGGHWDSLGRKPYQQYGLNGGMDHVSENVYILQFYEKIQGIDIMQPAEKEKLPEYLKKAEEGFMIEKPPHDGHRQQILSPNHTHVGIGYAMGQTGFRYVQDFLDRYLNVNPIKSYIMRGDKINITGTVLNPDYGSYGAVIYYDPPIKPLPSLIHQPERYPDFGQELYIKIPPWETKFDNRTKEFSIPVSFDRAKSGLYYVMIYVRSNPRTIPYFPAENIEWNTREGIPATSIVLEVH